MSTLARTRLLISTGLLIVSLLTACSASQTGTSVPTNVSTTTLPTEAANPTSAATSNLSEDTTPKIVAAGDAFLGTLSDSEKDTVLFDWTDTAQKQRWSNFPPAGFQRAGLMWGNMNETQQNAWLAVMQATMSTEGYNRVLAEWNADEALLADEGTGGGFGKANYYIALIGTPSETDPWQWQWGGHHVTVNATIVGPNVALTPSFIGCQPCTYTDANGNTVTPLADIEQDAFALMNLLDDTQKQAAVLGDTPIDLVLGPGQDGKTIQPEGLPGSQMNAIQQAAFLKLIEHYSSLVNDEDAASRNAGIQSNLGETYFAWYGPTAEGSVAYFRVTGPTIVIEYAPQGAGGGPGQASGSATTDHIHGIYRDPTNDYGAKNTQ